MTIKIPCALAEEPHMGDAAYSLIEEGGLRVAVGLTLSDGEQIRVLLNEGLPALRALYLDLTHSSTLESVRRGPHVALLQNVLLQVDRKLPERD
jgi:hypothetical protein